MLSVTSGRISLILWLHNVSLYTYIPNCFFIRSFVRGHLGCFHVSATANNAAMNMEVQIVISFPLDKYSDVGLLDHVVVLFLVFLRNPHTLFCNNCTSL